jgi:hypothetical protein
MGHKTSKLALYPVTVTGYPQPANGLWGLSNPSQNGNKISIVSVSSASKLTPLPTGVSASVQFSADRNTASLSIYQPGASAPVVAQGSNCVFVDDAGTLKASCPISNSDANNLNLDAAVEKTQSYADDVNKNNQSGLFWLLLIIFLLLVLFLIFRASRR